MHLTEAQNSAPVAILLDALHSVAAGSERQIYQLIQGLVEQQVQVQLILLRHTAYSKALQDFPCPILCLNITSLMSLHCIQAMLKLRLQLQADGCRCVHAWLPESCLLAPLFLKNPHRKIITSRRDMGLIYQGKPAWLYRLVRHRTDRVIGNSHAVIDFAAQKESLSEDQLRVIPNGIEPMASNAINGPTPKIFQLESSLKLILVANIKPIKRQLDAVEACLALNDQGTICELALIGEPQDSVYYQTILAQIQQHPAGERIYLSGSFDEPRRLLTQAHIGLLTSESEGLSNTLMEYMSAGLAIIATQTGGNPELIKHNDTGLLVPVANQPALIAALQVFASQPGKRTATGSNARKLLESHFSRQAMVAAHMQEYFSHCEKGRAVTC